MPNLQGKLLGAGLYVGCPRYHQLTRLERLVKPGLVRCGSPKRRAVIKANGGGPSNILDGRAVNCGATPEVTLISGDSPELIGCLGANCLIAMVNSRPRIAVETLIAKRPPHRTERARFGHSAPTLGV